MCSLHLIRHLLHARCLSARALAVFAGGDASAGIEGMQQALALPNLVARGNRIGGEVSAFDPAIIAGLAERGIDLEPGQGEDSGVHAVLIRDGRVDGGYDPRREGVVLVGEP